MRSLVSALSLGVCTLVLVTSGVKAQGLPQQVTVTSGNSPVVQADQTINASGTVTIGSGSSVTFQAGNTITLQNGFHAAAGSNFTAFIAQPDFVITVAPVSPTVLAGYSASYTVTVTSLFNFAGTVSFSPAAVAGLPQGASARFSPTSITPPANGSGSATLTIGTTAGVTGNFSFLVSGSSPGYLNHYAAGALSVQDFYLTLSPSFVTAPAGGTATYQITATGVNGFSGNIGLGISGDVYVKTPFQSPIPPGTNTSFTLLSGGSQASYPFQISGSSGAATRTTTGYLNVSGTPISPPTASCAASPANAAIGQTVTFTATVSGGTPPYTSYVWSDSVPGSGPSISFSPTTAGYYPEILTVTDSNGATAQTSCTVAVQEPINVTINVPSSISVTAGQSVQFAITSTALNGYSGSVTYGYKPGRVARFRSRDLFPVHLVQFALEFHRHHLHHALSRTQLLRPSDLRQRWGSHAIRHRHAQRFLRHDARTKSRTMSQL